MQFFFQQRWVRGLSPVRFSAAFGAGSGEVRRLWKVRIIRILIMQCFPAWAFGFSLDSGGS